ncbi:hypothetical protein V202x_06950 [Gimesia aquarii]|uniref:Uncharacterized protein n=1 Tax=Gimesia aquarii TaxID=2527964 RepID=A0A517WQ19_9PLAN|nr:hypothetical protein V202x_06950 [Gimesia aquarii]
MTGQLQGTLFGRPVELNATGRELLLQVANLKSAWRLGRCATMSMLPLLRLLKRHGIVLRVCIGSRLTVKVLPRPSFALRVLAPALHFNSTGE